MNEALLIDLLNQLNDSSLLVVQKGQALLLVDDASLSIGNPESLNVLVASGDYDALDAVELRRALKANAGKIVDTYYQSHPLSWRGFDRQVKELCEQYGHITFTATPGQRAEKTLFVEQGTVIALSSEDPRYSHGIFYELAEPVSNEDIKSALGQWIGSGQAYDGYLSMNICRYDC